MNVSFAGIDIVGIAHEIGDPSMIIIALVIAGQFYLILKREDYIKAILKEIADGNRVLSRLTALVEVMVHGRST